MFLLRANRSLSKEKSKHTQQNKMAEAISRKCLKAQQELAGYLQKKTDRLSAGAKKCCLFGFCVISSMVCVFIAIQSWQSPQKNHSGFAQIKFPLYINSADYGKRPPNEGYVKDSLPGRVKVFQTYMDSLSLTIAGRITRDSILAARPGLMDSIALLRKHSEFKISNH